VKNSLEKVRADEPLHDPTRSESLEGIRGLLAMAVFLGHSWGFFIQPVTPQWTGTQRVLDHVGALAVTCFYVLSGYVISLSLDANRRRNASGFSLGDFATARVFRILPPLLVTLLITHVIEVLLRLSDAWRISREDSVDEFILDAGQELLALATLTIQGQLTGIVNAPLWTLVWEIRCYVFAGLIACVAWGRPWQRVASAAGIVLYAAALGFDDPLAFVPVVHVFVQFGLGAAAARQHLNQIGRSKYWACTGCLGVLTAAIAFNSGTELLAPGLRPVSVQLEMLVSLWFAGLLIAVSGLRGPSRLAAVGSISYTLYILHYPIEQAARFALFNWDRRLLEDPGLAPILAAAIAVVTLAICAAVGTWVERPASQRAAVRALLESLKGHAGRLLQRPA
jgi:peptidoglycan/LPS O-acetylase OafA/YrhL